MQVKISQMLLQNPKVLLLIRTGNLLAKMTLIMRDILYGNPRLDELGWHEEALGRNAVAGGFQGTETVDRRLPNAIEAILASTHLTGDMDQRHRLRLQQKMIHAMELQPLLKSDFLVQHRASMMCVHTGVRGV